MEDAGALVGLMFALFGVGMAAATGDSRWDAVGAIAVGTLLVVIAIFLALEMVSMLVGESALPEQQQAIEEALASAPLVDRVIHLRTLHTGPDELLVAAKIAVTGDDTATGSRPGSMRPSRRFGLPCRRRSSSSWSRPVPGPRSPVVSRATIRRNGYTRVHRGFSCCQVRCAPTLSVRVRGKP